MSTIHERNSEYRARLFQHLDGIAVAPAAYELYRKGILHFLLEKETVPLSDLTASYQANEGYLNVALRLLAAQGWLQYKVDNRTDLVTVSTNERSSLAFERVPHYQGVVDLMKFSGSYHSRKFEKAPFLKWLALAEKYESGYFKSSDDPLQKEIDQQILAHIEGVLVGPTTVRLGMTGMFHKYFMETAFSPAEYHTDPESFSLLLDFFAFLGWFEKKGHTYKFTDKGLFYAKRSTAYGVTVSYIPTFIHLNDLLFGNPLVLQVGPGEIEKGVDREMNVWGSGGAHVAYFKKVDEIIIELFNRPIQEQPKGILDMGCGNGAFLIHIFDVIYQHTRRGKVLEEYPLFLVGADYNEAALRVSRAHLINADVWAKMIWGDIGDPDRLATDLRKNYEIELEDLLNVRTFLDHNRVWEEVPAEGTLSISTGAFASGGRRLSNNAVEANLIYHLNKWKPYIRKHGLVMIELHGLDPELTAQNLGRTVATAYEATHGFSDQYILELASFDKVVKDAGLKNTLPNRPIFPDSELATVSINYLI